MLLNEDLLLNYKRCQRRTFLDIYGNLEKQETEKEFVQKLKKEHQILVTQVISTFKLIYHQTTTPKTDIIGKAQETLELMQSGVEVIYDSLLFVNGFNWHLNLELDLTKKLTKIVFVGSPILLIKQPGKSIFGHWHYTPCLIKLGSRPKAEYKIVAAFYAHLLYLIQGVVPEKIYLILRQQDRYLVNLEQWLPKMKDVVRDCVTMVLKREEPELFISRQRCSLCHWYSYCYNIAKQQEHLCLIPGITPNRYEYLKLIGVDSLEALADVSLENVQEDLGGDIALQLKQQAQSLLKKSHLIKTEHNLSCLEQDCPVEIYFDIEAEPDKNVDYLLGVLLVDREKHEQTFFALLAETPAEEEKIWQQFLTLVDQFQQAPIFHYSEYEVETIKRLGKIYQTPEKQIKSLLSRCIDLHFVVTNSVIFPVESYSLKSLANWLGFQWRSPGISGDQCVCWYDTWLQTGDRNFLTAILRYNEDDCLATYHLKNWLTNQYQLSKIVD